MGHAARTDPFRTSTFSTQTVAAKHPETLFLKADVANAPWLVVKMSVKILPCLIAFVGGAAKDKCVLLASLHATSGSQGADFFSPIRPQSAGFRGLRTCRQQTRRVSNVGAHHPPEDFRCVSASCSSPQVPNLDRHYFSQVQFLPLARLARMRSSRRAST
jgi:hypothetical protein